MLIEKRRLFKVFYALATATILFALIITYSRGGLLGLLGMLIIAAFSSKNKTKSIVACLAAIIILVNFMPSQMKDRISNTKTTLSDLDRVNNVDSTKRRFLLARAAWKMFLDHPLFGVGVGNFYYGCPKYEAVSPGRAHSMYLEMLAELGAVGFFLFVRMLFYTFKSIAYVIKQCEQLRGYARGLFVGLVGVLIAAIFLHAQQEKGFWFLIFMSVALKNISNHISTKDTPTPDKKRKRIIGRARGSAHRKAFIALLVCLLAIASSTHADEAQFDKYGGWMGLKGKPTGWFHTEQMNGRWWIITPEGNVFWSIGMYCVRIGGLPETGTKKRAYRDACIKKYGNEREWARVTKIQLKDWRFNTVGDWSSESIYKGPGLAYIIGIDLSNKAKNVIPEGYYGYFPDVFSQEFKDSAQEAMRARFTSQPNLKDDPWLLGYFLADEPSWYGSKQRHGALVDDFINLDSDKPGKKAWVDFIKNQYNDIADLNRSWGLNFSNYDDLLGIKKIADNENTKRDKLAFLRRIAEEFAKVLSETLREFDKNHMILGMRPSRRYPEVIEGISKYSDIFSTSAYDLNRGYKIDKNYKDTIETIYKYSKKPIMLATLITAQDTGLPRGMVKTQKDRGISYWRYISKVSSDPRIIGMHWFQYFDPPKKCYDKYAANWGLVNEDDEPYQEAVSLISQANKMVYAYALGLSEYAPEFDSFLTVSKPAVAGPATNPDKNIPIPIQNGDFEQGKSGWSMQTWKGKSKLAIDSSSKHSGKYSLKITGGPDEGWGSVGVGIQGSMPIVLKPEYQYKLSSWIKVQNVENSAFVRIKINYKNGEEAYFATVGAYGTEEWKQVEVEFEPSGENTIVYLGAQLVGRGSAWFDDIQLEVTAPEGTSPDEFVKDASKAQVTMLARTRITAQEDTSVTHKPTTVNRLPISNPGFEEGKKDWGLQAWKGKPRINIDNRSAHSGKNSVKIQGTAPGWESSGVAVKGTFGFSLTKDKKYMLSGWIKTDNVEDSAFVRIKVKYEDGKEDYFATDSLGGTRGWEFVSKKFTPKNSCKIEYLACQLVGKGTVWFDDIAIEEIVE
ncbi:MAG: O-antigen ligase family protein [Candidatus Omnitrophota bacterium]